LIDPTIDSIGQGDIIEEERLENMASILFDLFIYNI